MVVVNTNPLYTARELEHQLKDSGAKAIVVLENFAHVLQEVIGHTAVKKVLVTAVGDMLGAPKSWIVNFVVRHKRKQVKPWHIGGAIDFRDALAGGKRHALNAVFAEARGRRVSSIHRRHHGCVEGRDAHASEHHRQRAAGPGMDRARRSRRKGAR